MKLANTVEIMEIPFVNETNRTFIDRLVIPQIQAGKKCFVVTANPEIVMETRVNRAYKNILQEADFVVPDGIGILVAAKLKRQPLTERIAGVDVMNEFLTYANENGLSCYFLGGKAEVNAAAMSAIGVKFPNLVVVGGHHGYFEIGDATDGLIVEEIRAAEPDFVFAALGFPKQEMWIARYLDGFKKGVFIGVGGSIDIYAGNVNRAPEFWIKMNLEWFYRLLKQPFRWKRILKVFKFLWLCLRGR